MTQYKDLTTELLKNTIRQKLDFLITHNKNYTKKQLEFLDDINEMILELNERGF